MSSRPKTNQAEPDQFCVSVYFFAVFFFAAFFFAGFFAAFFFAGFFADFFFAAFFFAAAILCLLCFHLNQVPLIRQGFVADTGPPRPLLLTFHPIDWKEKRQASVVRVRDFLRGAVEADRFGGRNFSALRDVILRGAR